MALLTVPLLPGRVAGPEVSEQAPHGNGHSAAEHGSHHPAHARNTEPSSAARTAPQIAPLTAPVIATTDSTRSATDSQHPPEIAPVAIKLPPFSTRIRVRELPKTRDVPDRHYSPIPRFYTFASPNLLILWNGATPFLSLRLRRVARRTDTKKAIAQLEVKRRCQLVGWHGSGVDQPEMRSLARKALLLLLKSVWYQKRVDTWDYEKRSWRTRPPGTSAGTGTCPAPAWSLRWKQHE